MNFSPKSCLAMLALFFTMHLSAQTSTLKQGNNGKLFYSYVKNAATNNFELKLVYKNEQVIYKQQFDSLVIATPAAFEELHNNLQKAIESLSDPKANAYFEKPTYSLFKFENGILGTFVSISNPSGSIVANNTKAQALDFLNWLKSIQFGKE
jgi:hypothetical protein